MAGWRSQTPWIALDIELYRHRVKGGRRAGFFSSKIVAVGIGVYTPGGPAGVDVYTEDEAGGEAGLLKQVLARLESLAGSRGRGPLLGGYNLLSLDLPVIVSRTYSLLGEAMGRRMASLLYRRFLVVDMFQLALAEYTGEGLPGFSWFYNRVACRHGLPLPWKDTGYNVHEAYEEGRIDAIREYTRLDTKMHLVALAALAGGGDEARIAARLLGLHGPAARC